MFVNISIKRNITSFDICTFRSFEPFSLLRFYLLKLLSGFEVKMFPIYKVHQQIILQRYRQNFIGHKLLWGYQHYQHYQHRQKIKYQQATSRVARILPYLAKKTAKKQCDIQLKWKFHIPFRACRVSTYSEIELAHTANKTKNTAASAAPAHFSNYEIIVMQ